MIERQTILDDFKRAKEAKRDWIKEAIEDYEFAVGKQWDENVLDKLAKDGVRGLTINKIQPNIFLVSGIQRQNRSDFRAFPEGGEDTTLAEITTRLLKNVMKCGRANYKLSEMFEDGLICGEGWLEPYIDYTYDLLNGEMKFKKVSCFNIYPDPDFSEYDLSDAEYIDKFTSGLSEKQAIQLFPDKEEDIKKIKNRKLDLELLTEDAEKQTRGYSASGNVKSEAMLGGTQKERNAFDLLEHHYRSYVKKYLVVDRIKGKTKEADKLELAEAYVKLAEQQVVENDKHPELPKAAIIVRTVPELRIAAMLGDTLIDDYVAPFYPRWKTFGLIPFFAHRITTPLKEIKEYQLQGIVRSLKDPQRELNKRRTQELRHLNSTTNSGWISEKGAWVKKAEVKRLGASAGVVLEYNQGYTRPERITPAPLSQGHAQLAAENTQDMKEISGINSDLLAMGDQSSSGRAIALRQQQGVVMIQRILDNFGHTKQLLGRFILSQLGELYTIESAIKVCGNQFIKLNFSRPVMQAPQTDEQGNPISAGDVPETDERGELVLEVNQNDVLAVFNMVLNDEDVAKYDVAVGEGAYNETIRYSNSLLLMEMLEKGAPIPPEIIIEESMLNGDTKNKIKAAIATAQKAQQADAQAQQAKGQQAR